MRQFGAVCRIVKNLKKALILVQSARAQPRLRPCVSTKSLCREKKVNIETIDLSYVFL
ncbi:MAG: hypothetical protein L6V93_20855 [Clostridiales bacterium]|nr:MAG: hypothetical protein L6V93_20855 [Clostridiales bacterium]